MLRVRQQNSVSQILEESSFSKKMSANNELNYVRITSSGDGQDTIDHGAVQAGLPITDN